MKENADKNVLVLLDFDDTIVVSSVNFWSNYVDFLSWFYSKIKQEKGDDPATYTPFIQEIMSTLESFEEQNLPGMGFCPARMEKSLLSTLKVYKIEITDEVRKIVREFSNLPYDAPLSINEDILSALDRLSEIAKIVIWTRGDTDIQTRRVLSVGLEKYISAIYASHDKTSERLLKVVEKEIEKQLTDDISVWIIGNSLEYDILPAIGIGVRAILVGIEEYSGHMFRSFDTVRSIVQAVNIIDRYCGNKTQKTMDRMFK